MGRFLRNFEGSTDLQFLIKKRVYEYLLKENDLARIFYTLQKQEHTCARLLRFDIKMKIENEKV